MKNQHPKKAGFVRSLFERHHSPAKSDDDVLLQNAVNDSLAQLSAFARQGKTSRSRAPGNTALSCAHNAFGFDLFRLLSEGTWQNVFISPTSVALALSMVYNGADGETQQAMAQTLHLQDMSLEEMNKYSASLMEMLNEGDAEVELCTANSLWMQDADCILPEFQERSQKYFQAELHSLLGAPDTINDWVSAQTRGKINQIVGDEVIQKEIGAVLVNAIYFRG
jgi:serpin B